jgi:hypothetical protein
MAAFNRNILNFVNYLEGCKTNLQNIHWDARNFSQHKLCDDIASELSDFEDFVSEVEQSITTNLSLNRLRPKPEKISGLKAFLKDLLSKTKEFYNTVGKMGPDYVSIKAECENFMGKVQRFIYLTNFTLKEDFKRHFKEKVLNEGNNMNVQLTEGQLKSLLRESVTKVLEDFMNDEAFNDNSTDSDVDLEPVQEARDHYFKNEVGGYSHFAVNRETGKIVNGWDYRGYPSSELKSDMRYYFWDDLKDNDLNPKDYKILSRKYLDKAGVDVFAFSSWADS